MKVNDSGMPEEVCWNSLFDVNLIMTWLSIGRCGRTVVEIGCGYGTLSVPVASRIRGKLVCYDIEEEMIRTTKANLDQKKLRNYELQKRDVLDEGIAIDDNTADAILLFNILHFKERKTLLKEAMRAIAPGGTIAVIHWRKDIDTPRGPALEIRPSAEDVILDAKSLGLNVIDDCTILEPYHWGVKLTKKG